MSRVMLGMAAPIASAFKWFVPGNAAYPYFARHGFHLIRKNFYLPIPEEGDLDDLEPAEPVGVDMNESGALELLRQIFPPYCAEFRRLFPVEEASEADGFYLLNGLFMAGDAHAYYALVRHHKPGTVIEIGSGFSTLVAAAACRRNLQDGNKTRLIAVEPYPSEALKRGVQGLDELIAEKVQTVDLQLFTSLKAGDVLFVDSTHVLRPGGDVQRIYCEILPRLAPGVLVHIHDISLPKPYPRCYFENHLYWNEQYLLQAFLTYNSRFEVVFPAAHMYFKHPVAMTAAFPEIAQMRQRYPQAEPSSFWMRVKP